MKWRIFKILAPSLELKVAYKLNIINHLPIMGQYPPPTPSENTKWKVTKVTTPLDHDEFERTYYDDTNDEYHLAFYYPLCHLLYEHKAHVRHYRILNLIGVALNDTERQSNQESSEEQTTDH